MPLTSRRSLLLGAAGMLAPRFVLSETSWTPPAALVIGISDYDTMPKLPSATRDAALVGTTLQDFGYQVSLLMNPTMDQFLHGVAHFQKSASAASLTVIYLAAHGGFTGGQSHFFLRDARLFSDRIPETLLLTSVGSAPKQKALFLDSCRESTISGTAAFMGAERYRAGIYTCYASQPNAPAFDGGATHSPFATALKNALLIPRAELSQIGRHIRVNVVRATGGLQIPWERSSLLSPILLNPGR